MAESRGQTGEWASSHHKVTVVLPIHNEQENLIKVVTDIDIAFQKNKISNAPFLLFVDDGSSDNSLAVINTIISERGNACCISFSRNFGHQVAVMAGFAYAPDDSIVLVMDSDGQDPPDIAAELVRQVINGTDVAYGVRRKREGRNWLKRVAYWSFYRILAYLSSVKIPLDAGDFCAYSPKAVNLMTKLREKHPYVRGLRAWVGLTQVGIPYRRPDRHAGEASYNFSGLFKLAFDGIVSFSLKPLRLSITVGFVTFLLCILLGLLYLISYFFDWYIFGSRMRDVPGFTTLVLLILTTSSFQMLMLGVIGEYLGRLFEESKGRPLFIVAETFGDLHRLKKNGSNQPYYHAQQSYTREHG